jgi:uncharacterized protein involved in oxidation of intracellular sulfur
MAVVEGYYDLELMMKAIGRTGEVLLCGICMDARGIRGPPIRRGPLLPVAARTTRRGVL